LGCRASNFQLSTKKNFQLSTEKRFQQQRHSDRSGEARAAQRSGGICSSTQAVWVGQWGGAALLSRAGLLSRAALLSRSAFTAAQRKVS
jgi:hypothetical protein